jgi:thiol-disulfide isomerase/thioredoxin
MLKTTKIAIIVGCALAIGLLAARKPLLELAVRTIVLHKNSPTDDAMDEVMDNSSSQPAMLREIWDTNKIVPRHYAITYIHDNIDFTHDNWQAIRPMVLESLASRDIDLEQPALAVLGREEPERARAIARSLVRDIDPEVRLLGLRGLAEAHDRQSLSTFVDCVADRETSVGTYADLTLCRLMDKTVDVNFKDPESIRAGEGQWRNYVNNSPATMPASSGVATPAGSADADLSALPPAGLMPAIDFSLTAINGSSFKLSDFRGKTVLLNFWGTGCGPCIAEMPALDLFHRRHPEVQMIGVCIDPVPDDDGGSRPMPDQTPKVRKIIADKGVTYPVAIDTEGSAVGPFDGSGVPLTVIIDRDGNIHRRFIGERSQDVLDQMVAEAAK